MFTLDDLEKINEQLAPLKDLADRELKSIFGLTGKVYTPHIDNFNEIAICKAKILLDLKNNGALAFTDVEIITNELNSLYKRYKHRQVVSFKGDDYECVCAPLKLTKSGKTVQKWARYWLKKMPDESIDEQWLNEVKEIWPEYFVIRQWDI
ncbi:hypothetical protein [Thalassotalea crassostreae]|uniref:hypothetical protein n=1 Tax=Thalassotalea crassostreae TaxID=1763536 RepID=UPI000838CCC9|nr:hypothetical protein [Thalassotalea crassostreae]